MAKMPKPLQRDQLLEKTVTDVDAFTAVRYLRQRDSVPALPDLEEKGEGDLPGMAAALLDIYHSLWSPEPGLRDDVPADRQYFQSLLASAHASAAYAELHALTAFSELKSVLGTVGMGETILTHIPKNDKQQLQQIAQAQANADELQQEANQAEAEAEVMEAVAGQMEGMGQTGDGNPSQAGGRPQAGQGPLSQAAAQARANAQAAKDLAQQAQQQAQALANELMGEPGSQQADEKLRELARLGQAAMKAAQTQVKEVSQTLQAWGLDEADLTQQGIPEALALLERMKRNKDLKKFASLLGRLRKMAVKKAKSNLKSEGIRVKTVEYGRDLRQAHSSELIALTHPALATQAKMRWARGELRQHGQKIKATSGKGSMIVCEDASGSMDGEKQQWAKALVLAMADYAKIQSRDFGWVMFDSSVRIHRTYLKGAIPARAKLEMVEARAGGGTDFERPLRQAMEMIKKGGLKKADILFITDGECEVTETFLKVFLAFKNEYEVSVFAVLCDVGSSSIATVKKFADRIEVVSQFTAETAEMAIINKLK